MIWLVLALVIFSLILNTFCIKDIQARLNVYENGLYDVMKEVEELKFNERNKSA